VTSAWSPPADRRRAARFLSALLDGTDTDVVALWDAAGAEPGGQFELVGGLAMAYLDELMLRHGGPAGAREQLALTLLDPDVSP
jgi:hypothetical protein